jgi:hypothetical protein
MKKILIPMFLITLLLGCTDSEVINQPEPVPVNQPPTIRVREPAPTPMETVPTELPSLPAGSSVGVTNPFSSIERRNFMVPTFGKYFTDPGFGTTLRRVGDVDRIEDEIGAIHWERHEYSQLQAFNSDNSLIMLNRNNEVAIRDVKTLEIIYQFPNLINDPRWNPAHPDEIYHYDPNGNGQVTLLKTNIRTQSTEEFFTFPPQYVDVDITASNEELSHDGKWIMAYLYDASNNGHFVALDLVNKQLGATLSEQSDLFTGPCGRFNLEPDQSGSFDAGPNWVGPSPLGNMVIAWNRPGNERCQGVEVLNAKTGMYIGHVGDSGAHSDIGLDQNGNEVYVSFQQGWISMTTFPGAVRPGNFDPNPRQPYFKAILDPGYGHIWHASCQGPKGVCVVTSDPSNGNEPFDGEVYLVYLDGEVQLGSNTGSKVRRLAHHRSIDDELTSSCVADEVYIYRSQPQASISRDGRSVVFASNWGDCSGGSYTYIIDLKDTDISSPAAAGEIQTTNQNSNTATNTDAETTAETSRDTPEPLNSPDENLGPDGLPLTTYALKSGEIFDLGLAEGNLYYPPVSIGRNFARALVYNQVGEDSCFATDFVNVRIFVSSGGNYVKSTLLDVDTGGCEKGNQMFAIHLTEGTSNLVACVSRGDGSENFCSSPLEVRTNPSAPDWS